MNTFATRFVVRAVTGAALLLFQSVLWAQSPDAANIAVVATPSSSSVSGDTRNEALNDGSNPRNSRGDRRGTYGNWPSRGTQWVQYDWRQPISTKQIEVYWWDDNQGVRLPKASRLQYWDGKEFVPVANASGFGVEGNKFNVSTFDEVTTSKLRLEMEGDGESSTGILEWRVLDSGKSPDFPPSVAAGVDRVVILGGKTYLSGKVKSLKPNSAAARLLWDKQSGPGDVKFADSGAADTTAVFGKPGDYVLRLTAGQGDLSSSSTLKVKVEPPPPTERLDVVYTKRYSIDNPLWNSRAKSLIVSWIPHCIDYINRTNLTQGQGGIDNFIEAAKAMRGEPFIPHKGYVFANAWVHQTVESMCIALMVDPQGDKEIMAAQEKMRATLETWIPIILAAQEPDGYMQTAFTARPRMYFSVSELRDATPLAAKFKSPASAIATYFSARLSDATREMLGGWNETNSVSEELAGALVVDLNRMITGPLVWDAKAFAGVNVRQIVRDHLDSKMSPGDLARLNRLLLEDALDVGRGGFRGGGQIWMDRWDPAHRADHEGYVAGYFIESAINHYTLTEGKDKRLYDAAKKLADCWVANIGPGKKDWYDGHQEMEQALVRFGRFVNDMERNGRGDSYVQLAKFLLDCRNNGSEYDQSHVPVQQQYEAVGHAVRAVYNYSGMSDVAAETGDVDYQSAVMSLWDNMVNKKYYVTGGVGSGETSEGFGPNYSLRNNAYCESCSSCGLIFFQHKLNIAYHDAKYADLYEETMYNALLGATDLEGKNFYYTNPLIGGRRTAWHACPCCVGNIPRTLLMIPTWTYVKDKQGIYVNLFIGSTINVERVAGTDVEMVQKTDYPWDGKVSVTVNPKQSKKFSVYVRVPDRTTSELYTSTPEVKGLKSFSVNGKAAKPKIENGYAVVARTWKAGDRIEFEVPMEVQRIKSDEKIVSNKGLTALRYGPLIYNVERADQPDLNGTLSSKPLSTEWRGDLLEGVKVIKGTWADGSPLTAIPHYARNNRLGQNAPRSSEVGGDSNVNYAPGTTSTATTNAPRLSELPIAGQLVTNAPSTGNRPRGRFGESSSQVWIKEQQ